MISMAVETPMAAVRMAPLRADVGRPLPTARYGHATPFSN
jgi:hypothetical protein